MKGPTPLQRAVLDALADNEYPVSTLVFHMRLSDSAIRSRLMAMWQKGLVDRGFDGFSGLVWWRI